MTSRAGRGALIVRVIADPSQFKRGMRETEQATSTMGEKFKAFGKVAAAAVLFTAGRAVTSFVRDSKQAYMDLNESLNAVTVTYGENADAIKRLGANAARSVGLSTAQFNSLAVSMANFAEQVAGPGGDVVEVVDEMTTRIADFASVMNLEVPEAAAKFQSGLAGQSRPLREFGIDVSDAAVQQFALANGIGETSRALTEGEKVQARYGLIMQQTEKAAGDFANTSEDLANSLRIAAAEAENNKAIIGEALLPVYQQASKAGTGLAKAAGVLALGFMNLTGQISNAEQKTREYQILMGKTADTAEDALAIHQRWNVALDELLPVLDLSRDELERARNASDDFLTSLGMSEDQIDDYRRALTLAINEQDRVTSAFGTHEGAVLDVAEAYDEAEEAVKSYSDTLREQSDPVFAAIRSQERLRDAQREATQARQTHGAGSREHVAAIMAEAEASVGYKTALEKLAEAGLGTEADLRRMLSSLGATPEAVDILIRKLNELEGVSISDKSFRVNAQAPIITYTQTQNMLNPQRTGIRNLARGGIVEDDTFARIGEAGDEAVVPLETRQGIRTLAEAFKEAGVNGGANGGATFNITVHAGLGADGHVIGEEVVRALEQWIRRNGTLPFRTA